MPFSSAFPRHLALFVALAAASFVRGADPSPPPTVPPIHFDASFEAGSIGRVEPMGEGEFRVHIAGQQDARGRNRQPSWFFFRMDGVRGRDLTVILSGYAPFEYNDKPAPPKNNFNVPVFSHDGETWQYFPSAPWDAVNHEATLRIRGERDALWIATLQPYPHSRLLALLRDLAPQPHVRVESMGRSVQGRDLPLVTVTDFAVADAAKKTVWLQTRQHAWETHTSFIAEGALRFVASDAPEARALRREFVFIVAPMLDPDGCADGGVRYNRLGWDVNRHWDEVDLRDPVWLRRAPEIWYPKKAVRDHVATHGRIDLMVNVHNTLAEYLVINAPSDADLPHLQRFNQLLIDETQYDPSRPVQVRPAAPATAGGPPAWWAALGVPYALLEARVELGRKLGGRPSAEQRMTFGRELIATMAKSVR